MKLQGKICLWIGAIFTLSIASLTGLTYRDTGNIMTELLNGSQVSMAQQTARQVDEWLSVRKEMIRASAETLSGNWGDSDEEMLKILKTSSDSGGFMSVYVGTEDGRFIDSSGWIPDAGWDHRGRPWYGQAKGSKGPSQTEPYVDSSSGDLIISLLMPLEVEGEFVGVVSSDISLASIVETVLNVKVGESGFSFIVDGKGKVLVHPDGKAFGKSLGDFDASLAGVAAAMKSERVGIKTHLLDRQEKILSFAPVATSGWFLCINADEAEIFAPLKSQVRTMVLLGALFLALGLVLAFLIARGISGPVRRTVGMIRKMEEGHLGLRLEVQSKDEVGEMAEALNSMSAKLQQVVESVQTAASNVASGSRQLSVSSEEMSQGATEQAASAEEASASMEQMSANIRQNSDNAFQTEKIAGESAGIAREGGEAVSRTVSAMRQIADKISIVEEIARQTNLLALNAAIEAARAGEHGKGFAVVAAEVRKLAERSQGAAAEISELSGTSVEVAEKAGGMLSRMVPDIQKTAELVQEISAASKEQDTGAEQVNKAIGQLDQVIQQNASTSEEMASSAEELSSQAEQLQETIDFFKLEAGAAGGVPEIETGSGELDLERF